MMVMIDESSLMIVMMMMADARCQMMVTMMKIGIIINHYDNVQPGHVILVQQLQASMETLHCKGKHRM